MKNKETLEEFAERISKGNGSDNSKEIMEGIIEGAKWQQERMYSEQEVYDILIHHTVELFKKKPTKLEDFWNKFKKK